MKATEMTNNLENKKGILNLNHNMAWGLGFGSPFFFFVKDPPELNAKNYLDF